MWNQDRWELNPQGSLKQRQQRYSLCDGPDSLVGDIPFSNSNKNTEYYRDDRADPPTSPVTVHVTWVGKALYCRFVFAPLAGKKPLYI